MAQETVETVNVTPEEKLVWESNPTMVEVEAKITEKTGGVKITVGSSPPSNPNVGDIWINSGV